MGKNTVIKNISASLLLQIMTIISGFVVPKVLLSNFGSEVYGLTTSITQFLNYISLLEGGLSGVIMAALYKPLHENDINRVSGIVSATKRFFIQIGLIYIVYVVAVAIIYPLCVETEFSFGYVCALTVVLAINLFVQYFFSLTYKLLLNADRKVYFVSITQVIIVVLNMLLVIVSVKIFNDIIIVKLISALIFFVQPIMYTSYVRKHYTLDKKAAPDNEALSQRWDGFGQNLAYFIHTNTDVAILTIFSTLSDVAVYAVYLMIANALKTLVVSISSAIAPSMGNILTQDDVKLSNSVFSIYEFGMWLVTTVLFTCGIILVVPFVTVYTVGITDANYYQPIFGPMILIAEMVYCIRDPYVSVVYAAGRFKQTAKYAYIEAGLNIILSILLVKHLGLVGVAIGTIVSMLFRLVCHVLYLEKNILFRKAGVFLRKCTCFIVPSVVCIIIASIIKIEITTYYMWLLNAAIIFVICIAIFGVASFLCYKDEMSIILSKVMKKGSK